MKYLVVFCDSESWDMNASIYDTYESAYENMKRVFNREVINILRRDCKLDIDRPCSVFEGYEDYLSIKNNSNMMYAYIFEPEIFIRCELFRIRMHSRFIKEDRIDECISLTVMSIKEPLLGRVDEEHMSVRRFNRSSRNRRNSTNNRFKKDPYDTGEIVKGQTDTKESLKDIKNNNFNEHNHPGRDKCDRLREIRRKIADANGIEFKATECHHTEPCSGTCPACDAEIRYIDEQLRLKEERGERIVLKGLVDDIIKSSDSKNHGSRDIIIDQGKI